MTRLELMGINWDELTIYFLVQFGEGDIVMVCFLRYEGLREKLMPQMGFEYRIDGDSEARNKGMKC
jgi:hypothetical protein